MSVIIAIDPGSSGGVAVAAFGKTASHAMPDTEGDRLELLRDLARSAVVENAECVCVLEEVNGFVGKAQPGSAMFKFGEHYGYLKGVIQALSIKLVLVRPQMWQKFFGLGTASRCASKTEWKNKLKGEAKRRFPQLDVTLKTADALLILEWAREANHVFAPTSAGHFTPIKTNFPANAEKRPALADSREADGTNKTNS